MLLPLLLPAILSSLMIVFAISIDDFVISQWLSCGADCDTMPIRIYSATRAAPLPSINALAAIMVYFTIAALLIAYFLFRFLTRGERGAGAAGGRWWRKWAAFVPCDMMSGRRREPAAKSRSWI